ncbi:MAG: hypothetical protein Kow0031_00850 [Anaerolineae bacterium]
MKTGKQISPSLLNALENERRVTANELHDGVAQTALQLGLQAGICRKLMEMNQLETLASELARLEERVHLASSQVRALIQDLRPPIIDDDSPDLQHYLEYAIQVHHQRGGAPVRFVNRLETDVSLTEAQMLGLMRIAQERLQFVRKYAQAEQVQLTLWIEAAHLYLRIADDGKKVDSLAAYSRAGGENGAGMEMTNLQARTHAVGGTLTVARGVTGSGTDVTVRLPL